MPAYFIPSQKKGFLEESKNLFLSHLREMFLCSAGGIKKMIYLSLDKLRSYIFLIYRRQLKMCRGIYGEDIKPHIRNITKATWKLHVRPTQSHPGVLAAEMLRRLCGDLTYLESFKSRLIRFYVWWGIAVLVYVFRWDCLFVAIEHVLRIQKIFRKFIYDLEVLLKIIQRMLMFRMQKLQTKASAIQLIFFHMWTRF